jgi:hypothetical protein
MLMIFGAYQTITVGNREIKIPKASLGAQKMKKLSDLLKVLNNISTE